MTAAMASGVGFLVHGYVRMDEPDEALIAETCKDMSFFCGLQGYQWGSVFIDRGVPDEVFARIGFTRLLTAVRLTSAYAVVVPTLEHLSSDLFVRDALTRMVEQLGARMLVAAEVHSGGVELEAVRGSGRPVMTVSLVTALLVGLVFVIRVTPLAGVGHAGKGESGW